MKYILTLLLLTSCSSHRVTYDDMMNWHDGCMGGAISAGVSDPIGGWMICDKLCDEEYSYTGYCEYMRLPKHLEE